MCVSQIILRLSNYLLLSHLAEDLTFSPALTNTAKNLFVFDRLVLYGLPGDKTDMNRWSEVAKKG